MYVIMGGNGHVGSVVADALLGRGEAVTIVTHRHDDAGFWRGKGAEIAQADANDAGSLRQAFRRGSRAFLLNPPADTKSDTDVEERATVSGILRALDGSGLEKIVAQSTAGARKGERIGDLSVLWELEEGLRSQAIPAAINRAAYYMSNWDQQLEAVRRTGKLQTMLPADLAIPMVAPLDLARIAAERLLSPIDDTAVRSIEGPERYSSSDVARAFSEALGKQVDLVVTPREKWKEAFLKLGFSERAADAYTRMTAVSLDDGFDLADEPIRGTTTLGFYVHQLVHESGDRASP